MRKSSEIPFRANRFVWMRKSWMRLRVSSAAAAVLCLCALSSNSFAQQKTETNQTVASLLAANPADVASLDAIMAAVYDVISGPAGKRRDWDRFRSLFIPGARLIPTGKSKQGIAVARVLTVEDYVERGREYLEKNGFFEREIARKVEQYGNIAHVFSTYESRHNADDKQPFARGINSFQLLNDGKRWWVVTIYWEAETPDNPLPAQYLPQGRTK
jgi:hypothetical protein